VVRVEAWATTASPGTCGVQRNFARAKNAQQMLRRNSVLKINIREQATRLLARPLEDCADLDRAWLVGQLADLDPDVGAHRCVGVAVIRHDVVGALGHRQGALPSRHTTFIHPPGLPISRVRAFRSLHQSVTSDKATPP